AVHATSHGVTYRHKSSRGQEASGQCVRLAGGNGGQGKPVLTHVPPSPANPLGKYWLGLSIPGVGIHGTNAPSSIYNLQTHGCIRLHPDDIEKLRKSAIKG